ncbi:MAG: NAD-dependent epimerase/dehydratase family protein [bacterium]|nr:NAD-dependent epimerase/dehydratase family protein [bacterium]
MTRILVTGAAGFIGFHLSLSLLEDGHEVLGLDNLNSYYDPALKEARLARLQARSGFRFTRTDLADRPAMEGVFRDFRPQRVVNLAAQAGVRHSLTHPYDYVEANLVGFLNVLEGCRHTPEVEGLVYASSSSVYGGNTKVPFSVEDRVDQPVSLYAATKKANELMAHCYSHLYDINTTGLRFFTVYGPWGRPDMAYYSFTKAILAGESIRVFNHGRLKRDFTYIDDVVAGIRAALARNGHCELYNLGNNRPVELLDFIRVIEESLGRKAVLQMEPMQPGDVLETWADIDSSRRDLGYEPLTRLEDGIPRFTAWYEDFHGVA